MPADIDDWLVSEFKGNRSDDPFVCYKLLERYINGQQFSDPFILSYITMDYSLQCCLHLAKELMENKDAPLRMRLSAASLTVVLADISISVEYDLLLRIELVKELLVQNSTDGFDEIERATLIEVVMRRRSLKDKCRTECQKAIEVEHESF